MFFAGSNARETIDFSGVWTGNSFADFLLGLPSRTTRDPTDSFRYHTVYSYNWFVQDDYAVSSRLTLNPGLRYEYNSPDVEKQNRLAQLNIETMNYEIAGQNGAPRALYRPDKNNFGPRFGFAFRPDASGQRVVRGGYGIFYDLAIIGRNLFVTRTGPPFQRPQTFEAGTVAADLTLSDPFPSARLSASPIFDAPSIDPNFRDAYTQHWNLDRSDKTVYLNAAAFDIPPRGTFGNVPRNYFDGPGTNNWDLMLAKNFRKEGLNVEFRTEFFNAFNHPSFNQPNKFLDATAFGTITSTLLENRQIQFGLKIKF